MLEEKIEKLILIKVERNENHNRLYRRLDTGQFVSKKDIEILQIPPIIIIPNRKNKGYFFKDSHSPLEANAILLGGKIPEKMYAASYCALTEK